MKRINCPAGGMIFGLPNASCHSYIHRFLTSDALRVRIQQRPRLFIEDLRSCLLFDKQPVPCFKASLNRPNISYSVRFKHTLDATNPRGAIGDLILVIKEQRNKAVLSTYTNVPTHRWWRPRLQMEWVSSLHPTTLD